MPQVKQTSKRKLQIVIKEDGAVVLDGWCQVGSTVYSNFYESDAEIPQEVKNIVAWTEYGQAVVWTDGGGAQGRARPLEKADFQTWIRREPIMPPGAKQS